MDKIYTFWKYNCNLWFSSTPDDDKYIYENFNHYLLDDSNYSVNNSMNTKMKWTSYCILYDQLLKHICRHLNKEYSVPNDFINNCYTNYNKFKDELNDFEFMFQLMPIRHTHQLKHVKFVLNETWNRLALNKDNQFIKKFLIATYERYNKCTTETNITTYINSDIIFTHDDILDIISPKNKEIIFN